MSESLRNDGRIWVPKKKEDAEAIRAGKLKHTDIPEEWFELPYEEFLENVVTLSAAAHYGFTPDELKEKEGLKEFFGFK